MFAMTHGAERSAADAMEVREGTIMNIAEKTYAHVLAENQDLRQRNAELETVEAALNRIDG
jgi:hypothetical protein